MADNNNSDEEKGGRWFPLESNPILMNEYCKTLGFDTTIYEFVDVFSHEDWALEMIPQPVQALVMLYPLTEKQLAYNDPDTNVLVGNNEKIWFIKQRIGNACGTIGILHSLMNLILQKDPSLIIPDSWLAKFAYDTPTVLGPIQKAERLESDNEIAKLHDVATSSEHNQTSRGNIDQDIITHFIAFIPSSTDNDDGTLSLYELDGRKDGPVRHGATTSDTFLYDACQIVQQFMQRDPNEIRFTMLALAPRIPSEED